ncbi:MalY/PatB family protein [Brevibacillus sp. SYSU BS000544]|uniref:MalY/PatB family protein n=1 Tax=Brevibacillus sp. SYSU BS000544 TaxID=3416443 RepID=UPI003CE55D39
MINKDSQSNLTAGYEDFAHNVNRKNTDSKKWDNLIAYFGRDDVVPMSIADMDFYVPRGVQEVLRQRTEHGVFGYVHQGERFFQAIVDWQKRRHDWDIKPEWITSSPGVVAGQAVTLLALTEPGDEIIVQPPVYPPFYSTVADNNRVLVENPLKFENGQYEIDFEDLEQKIGPKTKMLLFCSPHNPTGRCWRQDELEKLAAIAVKHQLLVVTDEIFADLVLPGNKHTQLASLHTKIADLTVTCNSPSKAFNIAGLSTSYTVISNPELRARYRKQLAAIGIDEVNSFGLVALIEAYKAGDEWLDRVVGYLQQNLEVMDQFIRDRIPQIKLIYPQATYMAWLDCREISEDQRVLHELFVNKAKIGTKGGASFGSGGAGFMRLNFAYHREVLLDALKRLEEALK